MSRFGNKSPIKYLKSLYAIEVLKLINFSEIHPLVGMMYAKKHDVPWYNDKAMWVKYFEQYKSDVINEVKSKCVECLLDLYEPLNTKNSYMKTSIPIPLPIYTIIKDFRENWRKPRYATIEEMELSMRHLFMYQDEHKNTTQPSFHIEELIKIFNLEEMKKDLRNDPIESFTNTNMVHHTLLLSILYRAFPSTGIRYSGHYGRLDLLFDSIVTELDVDCISWINRIPCRTSEGVIGINDVEEYEVLSQYKPVNIDSVIDRYLVLIHKDDGFDD